MQSAGSLARFIGPMMAGQLLVMDVDKSGNPLPFYGRAPCYAAVGILVLAALLTAQLPAKPITAES
jgi:hypothetical protein